MKMESIKIRYNVMQIHDIAGFANIRGGFVRENKDVYFVRGTGCGQSYLSEIEKMDNRGRSIEEQKGGYLRLNRLPQLCQREDIEYYDSCYQQYKKGEEISLHVKETGTDSMWDSQLMWACDKVSRMFQEGLSKDASVHMAGASESMVKNFMMKMLYQTDQIAGGLFGRWDIHKTYKFVYNGSVKKHEYLFCYFLTLLGIDVLLLLPQGEVTLPKLWLDLSLHVVLGQEQGIRIPEYQPHVEKEEAHSSSQNPAQNSVHKPAGISSQNPNLGSSQNPASMPVQNPTISAAANRNPIQGVSQNVGVQINGETNREYSSVAAASGRRELSFEELASLASSIVMIASHDKKGKVTGTGSGIMIAEDGYILTNNHVIAGGTYFSVRIEEEEQIYQTDEVIKYHALFDLALIRIERKLNPLPIYKEAQRLVRGQKVVAIGSPLGLFNSVSDGIISGFRHFENVDMMQFTAPISHGSSGGAVLNMYGELIGISTAGMDDGQNLNLAVDYNYILQFGHGIYS